jgi:uncharacterized protein YggE
MKQVFSILSILWMINLSAQTPEPIKQKTINVSGVAEMEVVPDEIYVQVDLREYDKRAGGKIDIETIKDNFIKAALSIGIKETDISVQGYQGTDGNYWWIKKNKKKNPDMKAGITYQVKLGSTKKMDELVQKLDDEATQNFFISRVSHSKIQDYKKQLKIQAVQAAKEKAAYLAEAINEKAGEALTINEPNEVMFYPQPVYANRVMKAEEMATDNAGGEPEPVIDFKKMKLKFEVNATFALK